MEHPKESATIDVRAFVHPMQPWSFYEVMKTAFCTFFLLVPRLLITFFLIFLMWLVSVLCTIGARTRIEDIPPYVDIPLSSFRQFLMRSGVSTLVRIAMFVNGAYWIKVKGKPDPRVKTILTNHTGWIDIVILLATICPSFVSKEGVQKIPLVGRIAVALQCIFCASQFMEHYHTHKRTEKKDESEPLLSHSHTSETSTEGVTGGVAGGGDLQNTEIPPSYLGNTKNEKGAAGGKRNANGATKAVTQRQDQFNSEEFARGFPTFPPLVIFPEGTTSNGKYIIHFRTGAFVSGSPVQPMIIKWRWSHFCPTWETIPILYQMFRVATQLKNNIEIEWLPPYVPNEEEKANPGLYADNVQKYMARHAGLPASNHTPREKALLHLAVKSGAVSWKNAPDFLPYGPWASA